MIDRCAQHASIENMVHNIEARANVLDDTLTAVIARMDKATEKMEQATEGLSAELARFETRVAELMADIRAGSKRAVLNHSPARGVPRALKGRPPGASRSAKRVH